MDKLLREALMPHEEPSALLNRQIMQKIMEDNQTMKPKRRIIPAAIAAVAAMMLLSVTAYAAWNLLSARDVAEELNDKSLASAFESESAREIGETQSVAGYDITLLGVVSGEELSDYLPEVDGQVLTDMSYIAVAVARTDGAPVSDQEGLDLLLSPYLKGYDPARYNIYTLGLGVGYTSIVRDGVRYLMVESENIEPFAGQQLYFGVADGGPFYNGDAYLFDSATGAITRNERYSGVNALFSLTLDPSKADADKAAALIDRVDHPEQTDSEEQKLQEEQRAEFDAGTAQFTPKDHGEYAESVESAR